MNNSIVLLKTLLMSTSGRNIFRYTKDKKKRRKIIGNTVGAAILYLMLMAYSVAMCVGYGQFGLIGSAPVMCALIISILAFMFTLFKTNGYLFNFKEYDMLMALPFEAKTVAASKFLYMYIKSLPWYLSISLAMLIGYGIYARPAIAVYPVWMILSLFLPIIPMLIASFIGYLIAKISSGFRKTNIIQTVAGRFLTTEPYLGRPSFQQGNLCKYTACHQGVLSSRHPQGWWDFSQDFQLTEPDFSADKVSFPQMNKAGMPNARTGAVRRSK